MTIKKANGRPVEMNCATITKLADALEHGASVTKACSYAGISRETFYRYYRNEEVFMQKMKEARAKLLYLKRVGYILEVKVF